MSRKARIDAYIHLNPVRTGIVEDLAGLKVYPFSGHSALMGKEARSWQDTAYVLALFGNSVSAARRSLQRHLAKWSTHKPGTELTGHVATQELSISGSDVAFGLNVDRSAISRAVQRVEHDSDLLATSANIMGLLRSQHCNVETTSP